MLRLWHGGREINFNSIHFQNQPAAAAALISILCACIFVVKLFFSFPSLLFCISSFLWYVNFSNHSLADRCCHYAHMHVLVCVCVFMQNRCLHEVFILQTSEGQMRGNTDQLYS